MSIIGWRKRTSSPANDWSPLYAEAGIREAWLVAFPSDSVFSYRDPSPAGYRQVRECRRGDEISPEAFPDTRFSVDEILG